MPSPILARADALMHRRRPSPGESEEVPLLTEAIPLPPNALAASTTPGPSAADEAEGDDIPVLLDMESRIDAAAAIPVVDHAQPGGLIDQLHAALDRELHPAPQASAQVQRRTQDSAPGQANAPIREAPAVPAGTPAPDATSAHHSTAVPAPARQRAASPATRPAPPELSTTALIELSQRIEQRLSALLPALIAETLNDYLQEHAERPPR